MKTGFLFIKIQKVSKTKLGQKDAINSIKMQVFHILKIEVSHPRLPNEILIKANCPRRPPAMIDTQ